MTDSCRATSPDGASAPPTKFADVPLTRAQVLAAARRYKGLPYSLTAGYVWDIDGVLQGTVNCVSFVLYVARDLGLLPADFQPRQYFRDTGMSFDDFCTHLLQTQLTSIAIADALPADILLVRNELQGRELYHVAFRTGADPAPYGSIIHAINFQGRAGAVIEGTAADIWPRLESAWRLPQIVEEGSGG